MAIHKKVQINKRQSRKTVRPHVYKSLLEKS